MLKIELKQSRQWSFGIIDFTQYLTAKGSSMTEDQLRNIQEFANLPFYDYDDALADRILRCGNPEYTGEVSEAEDDDHFSKLIANSQLVPQGAIRYSPTDVRAVFWKKR